MNVISLYHPENPKVRVLHQVDHHGRIIIRTNKGMLIRKWADILHCTALSNYTEVYFADGQKQLVCKTLTQVQEKLPDRFFVRVHKSHLVSLRAIRWVTKGNLEMNSGLKIPVAKAKQQEIESLLMTSTPTL